jgi:hypothetical protein
MGGLWLVNVNSCQPLFASLITMHNKKTLKLLYIIYIMGFYIMFESIFV